VKRYIFIALAVVLLALPGLAFSISCSAPTNDGASDNSTARAAIIDQLYGLQPNPVFINETVRVLELYGFEVDIYQGDEVTVDLYRSLPSYGYRLIIFRAHSGIMGSEGHMIEQTSLFTSEPYSETKHISEQWSDRLSIAQIDEHHPLVFAINDKFISQSMEGEFDNTVIIMMGCSCLYIDDMARAFVEKGASTYIAWDATVSLDFTDDVTAALVEKLSIHGLTVGAAVTEIMEEKGPDPQFYAVLKYYPPQSADKTLDQLIE
jgi:hypothetical protein